MVLVCLSVRPTLRITRGRPAATCGFGKSRTQAARRVHSDVIRRWGLTDVNGHPRLASDRRVNGIAGTGAGERRQTSRRTRSIDDRWAACRRSRSLPLSPQSAPHRRGRSTAQLSLLSSLRLRFRHGRTRRITRGRRPSGESCGSAVAGVHRSSGRKPVRFAIRASMRGPISSSSWKANTKSAHPVRDNVRWEPDCRLTTQPILSRAASTRRARVLGQALTPR